MSKEIEQLKNEIEEALNHLEAIDNANPSEALELVDKMANYILLDEEYGFIDEKEKQAIIKDRGTIKQALLKAQEPKQYLKWEDLEFTKGLKCQKVKMNDNDYRISYTLDDFGGKCCFLYDSARNHYIVLNKQFFNDLHLERVKE